jgi:hypothetical protein
MPRAMGGPAASGRDSSQRIGLTRLVGRLDSRGHERFDIHRALASKPSRINDIERLADAGTEDALSRVAPVGALHCLLAS